MKRKFRAANGKVYTIDESQVNAFLKSFPDAVEVTEYSANGKVYNISEDQLPGFMNTFPEAFPEKKKEPTETTAQTGTPTQGVGSQGMQTPSQKRVELSEKKSRVNNTIEDLYSIQRDMENLVVESRNPSYDIYHQAATKAQVNELYNKSKSIVADLKTHGGKEGAAYYQGIEQAIENIKSKAELAATQNWSPEQTRTEIQSDLVMLKNGLHEVEKSSGKPGIMSKEKSNVDLARYTEEVKKCQAEINRLGIQGRKDGWTKDQMQTYLGTPLELIRRNAEELAKRLPENQKYIAKGMVESAQALTNTYVASVGAWNDKQTQDATSGHNQWAAKTVSEVENAYNITADQQKQAGGVPDAELDAYMMKRGVEFSALDIKTIRQATQAVPTSAQASIQASIMVGGKGEAEKKIMDAAVSDYLTYMDNVNPSMAKTWRQKYEYLKNGGASRNAEEEQFLLDFEKKAMRLAMAALDRGIRDKQFEISSNSEFEKSLDLDKYRRSMMALEGESKKIQAEYDEANKKARQIQSQYEAETGELTTKVKNLQSLLQANMISEDDYTVAVSPLINELNEKQSKAKANMPNFEDLQKRQSALKESVARIQDETGVNDAAMEKLQSMGEKYADYGESYEKMNALVGINGQIGSFYYALKERDRENQRAAEFRAMGMDSEIGREIEEGPWYKEYLAKGLHYTVGQVWGSELVRGFGGMVGNQTVGLLELPAVYSALAGNDSYGWTDRLMDWTVDLKKSSGREGSFGDVTQYGYDIWMPGRIANFGGNVAGSIAMFATPGTYLNAGTKLTKLASGWGASYLLSQADMYEHNLEIAKEYNKSAQWAASVTQGEAVVLATIEQFVGDLDYMKAPEVRKSIARAFAEGKTMKEVIKGVIDAAPESVGAYLKKMIPEGIEEGAGTLGTDAYKEYLINGKVQYFNDTFNWENIGMDVLGGFVGGALGNVMSRPIKTKDLETATYLSALHADDLYKTAKNEKGLKDLKEKLEGPKKDLEILSTHTNWDAIDDGSKIRAFSLNQSIKGLQEQIETDKKSNIVDEKKVQQLQEMTEEMNEILSAPEAAKGASSSHYNNTRDLIEALQSGDSDLSDIIENPLWGKLTEDSRTQIEDISYDLRKLKESMKKMDKRSPEYKTALEQLSEGKKQIKEILNNTQAYDSKDIPGVSSALGEGQEPISAESQQRTSAGAPEAGGVLQTPKAPEQVVEELTKAIEDDNRAIEETGDPIFTPEARADMERQLFEAQSEQAKAATQATTEQVTAEGEPIGAVTTQPSTEEAATEEVKPEQKTDQQKEIERLEGVLAQDDQAMQRTGKGILASRPAVESQLNALKEQEKMTEKEDKRTEEESKRDEKEYESNKKSLQKVDPTMTERQADLATALFQQGMDAKKAIEEAKKKISLEERASKMKEVSDKVLAERKGRIAKEMGATAESLGRFFKNAGMKVKYVENAEEFEREYAKNGANKETEGMFIANDGTIVFNREVLEETWDKFGKNIMFHEAIHPVMNIIRNTDKKLYSSIVNGLKNEISRNADIKAAWDFANQDQYARQGEEVVEDEFIVESLAMIADGKLKLSTLPKQKRSFLVKALSKLGLKFGQKPLPENADDEALRKFAAKLHKSLTKGGLLEDVVGEENITKYQKELGNKVVQDAIGQPSIREFGKSGIKKKPILDDQEFIDKLEKDQVSVKTPAESLGDDSFMLTFPDDLFVGEIVIDGKTIAKFGGGIVYALVEGKSGRMWASVNDKTAKSFVENVNRALAQSKDGVAKVVLVKGAHIKHASSLQAKVGFVKTLLNFAKGNSEYESHIMDAIKEAYTIDSTTLEGTVEELDQYMAGTREATGQTMKDAADSYAAFRTGLVEKANPMLVDLVKKMGYGNEFFDKGGLKKSPPVYRVTNDFVDKIFAEMLQEDFLNNLPPGSAYAALKVTSPVKFEKDNAHPSYPWVIRTVDGSPVTVDIFTHSFMTYGKNEATLGRKEKPGKVSGSYGNASYTLPNLKLKPGVTADTPGAVSLSDKLSEYEALKNKGQASQGGRAETPVKKQKSVSLERARELLSNAEYTSLPSALELLAEYPKYLDNVAKVILTQRQKLLEGKMPIRDVAKAYILTQGSIGSDFRYKDVLEKDLKSVGLTWKSGKDDISLFEEDGKIRPEELTAWWLGTPNGQLALNSLEKGIVNETAFNELEAIRRSYGKNNFRLNSVFGNRKEEGFQYGQKPENKKRFNLANIAELTNAINETKGDNEKLQDLLTRINGISEGKKGFIGHMLGIGNMPTVDAVELNFWFTGKGEANVKELDAIKAETITAIRENISALNEDVYREISGRIKELSEQIKEKYPNVNIPEAAMQHVLHHWIWDKARQSATTHKGMYQALAQYSQGGRIGPEVDYVTKNGKVSFTNIEVPKGFNIVSEEKGYGTLYDPYDRMIMRGDIRDIGKRIKNQYPVGTPAIKDVTTLDLYSNVNRFTLNQLGDILQNLDPEGEWNTMASDVDKQKSPEAADELEIRLLAEAREALQGRVNEMLRADKGDEELGFDIQKDGLGAKEPAQTSIGQLSQRSKSTAITLSSADIVPSSAEDVEKSNVELNRQQIRGKLLNEQQSAELQSEIEANYGDATTIFDKDKQDIRQNLYNYDNPYAEKNINGVNVRIAQGLTRTNEEGKRENTYLLYADGKIFGEFYSAKDAMAVVKYIEDNLIKGLGTKEDSIKQRVLSESNITDLDLSRWMKENNVTSFSENPESIKKFEKDFGVKLSEDTIAQMSQKKAELPKRFSSLIKDVIDNIGNAYDSGMSIDASIKQGLTSQPWYDSLSDEQKADIDKIVQGVFGEQIAAQREKEATEQGTREPLSDEVKSKTQELEDLYHTQLDGNNKEKRAAKEAQDKILDSDPKLKYIWKNYRNILKKLQQADKDKIELTKSEACP